MSDDSIPASTPEPDEAPSRARKYLLPALAVIIALVAIGFLASQSGLDKALLRQQLDEFSTALAENARKEGRDISLTYEGIDIAGSLTNRHAVIIEPKLVIKPLATPERPVTPEDELILRTSRVEVFPKAANLSAMLIRLAEPLEFYGGEAIDKELLGITTPEPFEIDLAEKKIDDRKYLSISHAFQPSIALTYLREQQAEGGEEGTPKIVPVYETITVTSAPGGVIRSRMSQDGNGLGEAIVDIKDIAITPQIEPEGVIKVEQLSSSWKHTLNEQNKHVITAAALIGDITAAPEIIPYAPIKLVLEAAYEGSTPQTAEDVAAARTQEASFKLAKFSLTAKDANLTANADFVASGSDILPVGMANIALTNVPFILAELRRYKLLNPENEPLVESLAKLISGNSLSELKDANIDVNRVRGGSFTIGKSTFEEIFATVLANSMRRGVGSVIKVPAESESAPTVEDSTKPDIEPEKIQVDDGARG